MTDESKWLKNRRREISRIGYTYTTPNQLIKNLGGLGVKKKKVPSLYKKIVKILEQGMNEYSNVTPCYMLLSEFAFCKSHRHNQRLCLTGVAPSSLELDCTNPHEDLKNEKKIQDCFWGEWAPEKNAKESNIPWRKKHFADFKVLSKEWSLPGSQLRVDFIGMVIDGNKKRLVICEFKRDPSTS